MSFMRFFRDRLPAIGLYTLAWAMVMIFIIADGCRTSAAAVTVIFITAGLCIFFWDFLRKRRFYCEVNAAIEGLEKKYLISEVMEAPEFAEGEILCRVMSEACRSMYETVAECRRSSGEFREFIELWVHEVKLPVAGMMLMCHNDGKSGGKYLPLIKRMDDCIENVLFYARSENAEKDYIIKETALGKAFGAAATRNRDELQQRGTVINTSGLELKVMTDGKWLEYIFGQLIGNSMKYFSPDRTPELNVWAEENSDSTTLHFRDNGIGIAASDLPYIFGKSYTGQNGRERARSTGMGLYIVRSLCQRLGHSVRAESVQGEYTEIILTFGRNDLYMT